MLFYSVEDEEEGIICQSLMIKWYNMEWGGVLVDYKLRIMQLNIGKRTVSTTVRLSFSADSVGLMKNFCEIWEILYLAAGRGL